MTSKEGDPTLSAPPLASSEHLAQPHATSSPKKPEVQRKRTKDIQIDHDVDFSELLLSPPILKGLSEAGEFHWADVIAQAKSGTGKTCVFSVIALEAVSFTNPLPQAIILAPTREIAVQIKEVVNVIGKYCTGLRCEVFIGGMPLATDKQNLKNCQVVVGTPGRVKQLIESLQLRTESIRLFILDEADKLLDPGFQTPLNWIIKALPAKKQVMAFSATYPAALINVLTSYMTNPQHVMLCSDTPSLEGVKQYFQTVAEGATPYHTFEQKASRLFTILRGVAFHQCVVFCNNRARAQDLSDRLNKEGWASAYIAGGQEQQDRNTTMKSLRDFQLRILVSTDLTARGIDIDRVNLVINMEMPKDLETYLHRIGRTGRFGTFGVAVTFIAPSDLPSIDQLCTTYHTQMQELKEGEEIPAEFVPINPPAEDKETTTTNKKKKDKKEAGEIKNAEEQHADQQYQNNPNYYNNPNSQHNYDPNYNYYNGYYKNYNYPNSNYNYNNNYNGYPNGYNNYPNYNYNNYNYDYYGNNQAYWNYNNTQNQPQPIASEETKIIAKENKKDNKKTPIGLVIYSKEEEDEKKRNKEKAGDKEGDAEEEKFEEGEEDEEGGYCAEEGEWEEGEEGEWEEGEEGEWEEGEAEEGAEEEGEEGEEEEEEEEPEEEPEEEGEEGEEVEEVEEEGEEEEEGAEEEEKETTNGKADIEHLMQQAQRMNLGPNSSQNGNPQPQNGNPQNYSDPNYNYQNYVDPNYNYPNYYDPNYQNYNNQFYGPPRPHSHPPPSHPPPPSHFYPPPPAPYPSSRPWACPHCHRCYYCASVV